MIFKKIGNMENVEVICHYFPLSLKYWMIEWDKPDGGKES